MELLEESEKKPKKVKLVKKGKTTELVVSVDELHANFNDDITNILEQVGMNEKNIGNSVKVRLWLVSPIHLFQAQSLYESNHSITVVS